MTGVVPLLLAGAAGVGLGALYFGGLWLTVRALPHSGRPVVLIAGSFLVRMAVIAGGFYPILGAGWDRLLACLAGFVLVRVVVVSWLASDEVLHSREQQPEAAVEWGQPAPLGRVDSPVSTPTDTGHRRG